MNDHSHSGSPALAIISLVAAGLGASAQWLESRGSHAAHLFAAFTPDDLNAWTKAISNSVITLFNTAVGCYNIAALAMGWHRRRKAAHRITPAVPAPVEDGAGGQRAAGA